MGVKFMKSSFLDKAFGVKLIKSSFLDKIIGVDS